MRRVDKQIDQKACIQILKNSPRGVIALSDLDGYPLALPLNYYYNQETNTIYFHGSKVGTKMDILKGNNKVSFCVLDKEQYEPGQWAPYVSSVIVFGTIHKIEDRQESLRLVREIAEKYYSNEEELQEEIDKAGQVVQILELNIEHMSGKRIQEK